MYIYHRVHKTFLKLYRRHSELVSKYNVGLQKSARKVCSNLNCVATLLYKFRKIIGKLIFGTILKDCHSQKRCCYMDIRRQTEHRVVNPTMVDNFASILLCALHDGESVPRVKKVREKSRECHNHKPQPFPDHKRKLRTASSSIFFRRYRLTINVASGPIVLLFLVHLHSGFRSPMSRLLCFVTTVLVTCV